MKKVDFNVPAGEVKYPAVEDKIYDFCYDYGYEEAELWCQGEVECGVEIEDEMMLPMRGEEPDSFFEEFGEDAMWDYEAEYAGMAAALTEASGKKYQVWCDGYRIVAVCDGNDPVEYAESLARAAAPRAAKVFAAMFSSIINS